MVFTFSFVIAGLYFNLGSFLRDDLYTIWGFCCIWIPYPVFYFVFSFKTLLNNYWSKIKLGWSGSEDPCLLSLYLSGHFKKLCSSYLYSHYVQTHYFSSQNVYSSKLENCCSPYPTTSLLLIEYRTSKIQDNLYS